MTLRWTDGQGDGRDSRPFVERLSAGPVDPSAGTSMGGEAGVLSAAWRPDGLEVAFAANKTGPYNLFVRPRLGTELALGSSPWNQVPTSWSPDARSIAYTEFNPATGADVSPTWRT